MVNQSLASDGRGISDETQGLGTDFLVASVATEEGTMVLN